MKTSGELKVRKPAVAGKFYPGTGKALSDQIEKIHADEIPGINRELAKRKIIGSVVPHAGYMFSGYEAIHFFDIVQQTGVEFETIVIVHPNHTGMGEPVALDSNDVWESPLGTVELDRQFMEKLGIPESALAHQYEHSAEVMIPLLQFFLNYPFKIVPISMAGQTFETASMLANKIYSANLLLKKEILIIASSDFSHYEHPEEGKRKDDLVIHDILNLNSEQVYRTIQDNQVSVCGYGPIMTLMEYSKRLVEKPAVEVIRRGHSGDIIPSAEVVDYITILFSSAGSP